MKYIFEVKDDNDETVFRAEKPMLILVEEAIGRFERHKKEILKERGRDEQ